MKPLFNLNLERRIQGFAVLETKTNFIPKEIRDKLKLFFKQNKAFFHINKTLFL